MVTRQTPDLTRLGRRTFLRQALAAAGAALAVGAHPWTSPAALAAPAPAHPVATSRFT